jgi:hypothetical protein
MTNTDTLRKVYKLALDWSGMTAAAFKAACRSKMIVSAFDVPSAKDWCDAAGDVCDDIHAALWGAESQESRMRREFASYDFDHAAGGTFAA